MSELDKVERRAKEARERADEAEKQLAKTKAEASRTAKDLGEMERKAAAVGEKMDNLKSAIAVRESPSRRALVDISGGTTAFSLTAGINWLFRTVARKFPDSWWARNVDILQGAPHFVLGCLAYGIELYTRSGKPPTWLPSGWREGISEASKVFAELGASNVLRAIRVRMADGKDDKVAMLAELNRLRAQLGDAK